MDLEVVVNNGNGKRAGVFTPAKLFLEEKFGKDPSLKDTIIVTGYNQGIGFKRFKLKHKRKKIIVYQLEQLFDYKSMWYNHNSDNLTVRRRTAHVKEWLNGADEIWDYDLDNIELLKSEGYKNLRHVPLEPCKSLVYKNPIKSPEYDVVFYGALNERRRDYLKEIDKHFNLLIVCHERHHSDPGYQFKNMVDGCFGQKLFNHIFNAKLVINLHYYDGCLQEQVRLSELLSNNIKILSEKSRINYLNIEEFENTEDMINRIKRNISEVKEEPKSAGVLNLKKQEEFKPIKIGAIYNTFYGLELIQESINSIKSIVDYIVVVHQKVGFSGELEPSVNKEILSNLKVDKIIYYDKIVSDINKGVLDKRNIGLEACKNVGCDYIIPLDSDELYSDIDLLEEIKLMEIHGIDTLYSPIITYYYNRFHHFKDDYYVPSVYKVNERNFVKIKTSVLVDPLRKMSEGNFKISKVPMHHYSYIKDNYQIKLNNSISSIKIKEISDLKKEVYNHLTNWDSSQKALVHRNDRDNKIQYIEVNKNWNYEF